MADLDKQLPRGFKAELRQRIKNLDAQHLRDVSRIVRDFDYHNVQYKTQLVRIVPQIRTVNDYIEFSQILRQYEHYNNMDAKAIYNEIINDLMFTNPKAGGYINEHVNVGLLTYEQAIDLITNNRGFWGIVDDSDKIITTIEDYLITVREGAMNE